jgi:uncharacterized lipoprotein YmbA
VRGYCLRFALACLSVVGCAQAPVRYYTLAPPPEKIVPGSMIAIDVRVVHTPAQLNRSELVVRTGPTELTLLENERWASPVNDEIKDALRLELLRRLGGVHPYLTKLTLDIDVQHLEGQLGRYALLEASWSATLSAAGPPPTREQANCTFRADDEIQSGYAAIVEGYQREISALAESIVAVLRSPASGIDAPCQKSTEDLADLPMRG